MHGSHSGGKVKTEGNRGQPDLDGQGGLVYDAKSISPIGIDTLPAERSLSSSSSLFFL